MVGFTVATFDSDPHAVTVPRAMIPRPGAPGSTVRMWLQDLPPGQKIKVGVRPYVFSFPFQNCFCAIISLFLPIITDSLGLIIQKITFLNTFYTFLYSFIAVCIPIITTSVRLIPERVSAQVRV